MTGTTEDDVVGVVHIRALVDATGRVGDFIRPAIVLPDSVGVLQALGRMQKERGQLVGDRHRHHPRPPSARRSQPDRPTILVHGGQCTLECPARPVL